MLNCAFLDYDGTQKKRYISSTACEKTQDEPDGHSQLIVDSMSLYFEYSQIAPTPAHATPREGITKDRNGTIDKKSLIMTETE